MFLNGIFDEKLFKFISQLTLEYAKKITENSTGNILKERKHLLKARAHS